MNFVEISRSAVIQGLHTFGTRGKLSIAFIIKTIYYFTNAYCAIALEWFFIHPRIMEIFWYFVLTTWSFRTKASVENLIFLSQEWYSELVLCALLYALKLRGIMVIYPSRFVLERMTRIAAGRVHTGWLKFSQSITLPDITFAYFWISLSCQCYKMSLYTFVICCWEQITRKPDSQR